MKDYEWTGSVAPWKAVQEQIRLRTIIAPLDPLPRLVAGTDCAFSKDKKTIQAAAVVYDRLEQVIVETQVARLPLNVPYIPGYLSFREAPAILRVIGQLKTSFGAILFDGQGIAHPRRCGLATHIGVLLDIPSIGCAKSRLIGTYEEPALAIGSTTPLMDKNEQIGALLRTREKTRPLFISVGHRMDLASAVELVRACCTRYRLPEPTRIADQLSKVR